MINVDVSEVESQEVVTGPNTVIQYSVVDNSTPEAVVVTVSPSSPNAINVNVTESSGSVNISGLSSPDNIVVNVTEGIPGDSSDCSSVVLTYNISGDLATKTKNGFLTSYTYLQNGLLNQAIGASCTKTMVYDGNDVLTQITVS